MQEHRKPPEKLELEKLAFVLGLLVPGGCSIGLEQIIDRCRQGEAIEGRLEQVLEKLPYLRPFFHGMPLESKPAGEAPITAQEFNAQEFNRGEEEINLSLPENQRFIPTAVAIPVEPAIPSKKSSRRDFLRIASTGSLVTAAAAMGTAYKRYRTVHQPTGTDVDTTLDSESFLKALYEKNDCIAFGDTDHTMEEINLFVASHVKAMKEAGVQAIFIEAQRTYENDKDHYLQNRFSYQFTPTNYYLYQLCKENGVAVHLMDVEKKYKSPESEKEAELYFAWMKRWKENPETAGPAPSTPHHHKDRMDANVEWVELIKKLCKENGYTKIATIAGTAHLENPGFFTKDVDEMIADALGIRCARVDIEVQRGRKTPGIFSAGTWDPLTETPEFRIVVPKLPDGLKKRMTQAIFNDLVKDRKYNDLLMQPEYVRAFQNEDISEPEYLAMRRDRAEDYPECKRNSGCTYEEYRPFLQNHHTDWLKGEEAKLKLSAYEGVETVHRHMRDRTEERGGVGKFGVCGVLGRRLAGSR